MQIASGWWGIGGFVLGCVAVPVTGGASLGLSVASIAVGSASAVVDVTNQSVKDCHVKEQMKKAEKATKALDEKDKKI